MRRKILMITICILLMFSFAFMVSYSKIKNEGDTSLGKFDIPTKYYKALSGLDYDQMRVCKMSEGECVILYKLNLGDN